MWYSSPSARGRRFPIALLPLLLAFAACDVADPAAPESGLTDEDALVTLDAFEAAPPFADAADDEAPDPAPFAGGDLECVGTYGAISVDNVIVPDDALCRLNGTRVDGNVFVNTGAVLIARGVDVGGNIQSDGHLGVLVRDLNGRRSFVDGDVQIDQGGRAGVGLTTIGGNLHMEQNSSALLIALNRIQSNLQVNQNTGGVRIIRNRVAQSMQCQANDPPPTGFGNQAGDKEDQCADL